MESLGNRGIIGLIYVNICRGNKGKDVLTCRLLIIQINTKKVFFKYSIKFYKVLVEFYCTDKPCRFFYMLYVTLIYIDTGWNKRLFTVVCMGNNKIIK